MLSLSEFGKVRELQIIMWGKHKLTLPANACLQRGSAGADEIALRNNSTGKRMFTRCIDRPNRKNDTDVGITKKDRTLVKY